MTVERIELSASSLADPILKFWDPLNLFKG